MQKRLQGVRENANERRWLLCYDNFMSEAPVSLMTKKKSVAFDKRRNKQNAKPTAKPYIRTYAIYDGSP